MAVRRESVVLTLEDSGFSTGMAKAAASTAILNKGLHDLDGTNVRTTQSVRTVGNEMDVFTKKTQPAGKEIDKLSGRMRLFADAAITLGPALAPIGAAVVPVIAGLAAQLGAAAGAAGVAVLAFNGIGDGLKALNDYQLEPTAENLEKLNEEMTKIGPAGQDFVLFLDSIGPQLSAIQDTARAGLLPGVQEGLESLLTMGPRVQDIVANIAAALGEMSANAGEALAGPRFREFFAYIENTAGPTLMEMGRTLGNVTEGLANMMVAFAPAASDFTGGLERMTASFAEWSRGLQDNDSFASFLDYVREAGPAVVDLLGSMIQAVSGLVQAMAPVGAVVVPALTAVADAFAAIAKSPIGTPLLTAAAAFVAMNRAVQILGPGLKVLGDRLYLTSDSLAKVGTSADPAARGMTKLQKAAVGLAVLQGTVELIKLVDGAAGDALPSIDQLTERMLDLRDGTVSDLGDDFSQLGDSIGRIVDSNILEKAGDGFFKLLSFGQLEGGNRLGDAREEIELLDAALVNLANTGGIQAATDAFDQLVEAQGLTGAQAEELRGLLTGYTDTLTASSNATRLAADATRALGTAEAAQARATQEAVAALRAKRDAALAAFDAETAYRQALVAARQQAANNTAGIKGNSEAALANRAALSQLAAAWNDQSAKVRNNTEKFREARGAFIDTAQAMGVSRAEAIRLADAVLAIPKSREIKITADTSAAMAALYQIQQYQFADKIVRVHTVRTSGDGVGYVSGGRADGGTIPRAANGSTVPKDNKPYGDRYLYMLAPGEEVISNRRGQADRFRPLLKAINNAADGATVGGRSSFGLGASVIPDEMREFARATELSRRGLLAELRVRARLLDKDLEAHKSRLDALKSERDSIAQSVKARLQSDIFAKSDQRYITLDRPDNWNDLSPEAQRSHLEAEWSVNQAMGYGQSQSPADILRADLERARQMSELVKRLKSNGLNGNALGALLDGGDLAQIQAYAGDRDATREYERLFNQRERVSSSVGAEAGNAAYGRAIREQTAEVRELRKETQQTNKRLERLEELAKKNPKETGAAVGKEVNGAAAAGQRRRS